MKTKQFILLLLALLTSIEVNAYDFKRNGIYYNIMGSDRVYVTFQSKTRVYDESEIPSGYHYEKIDIGDEWAYDYYTSDMSGAVYIPEFVTYNNTTYFVRGIGYYAFHNCNATSISIPWTIENIAEGAFSGFKGAMTINCSINATISTSMPFIAEGFSSLTLGREVRTIPSNTFRYCANIASLTLSNSLTSIGDYAFSDCRGLTYFTLPSSLTSIGANAFSNCSSMTAITIPNRVTTIGYRAFYGCSSLTSVTIHESVTSIGSEAFSNCNNLTSVYVGWETPLTITSGTFPNRANATLYVPIGCKATYEAAAYWNEFKEIIETPNINFADANVKAICVANWDTNGDGELSVAESATVANIGEVFRNNTEITSFSELQYFTRTSMIPEFAFQGCSNLTTITIPNSVISIEGGAFENCSSLTSITIPESVTSIGNIAFENCSGLPAIIIPTSVTSIGSTVFYDCSSLTAVTVGRETPLIIDWDVFSNRTNATLYVPAGCKAAYEAADYWKEFKEIVEMPPIVNVGSTGFATFCSPVDVDFSSVTDIKAYIASGFNPSTGTLVLTRVTEVPAGEGLYIVGDEGSYNVPITTTAMIYSNLLKGVITATTISPTDGDKTNFILANGSHGVGFYTLSSAGELAGGKAYLQLPTASVAGVKAISFVFNDGDETGISNVKDVPSIEGIYNLQGQRISQPRKGLNIINGKKVIIK